MPATAWPLRSSSAAAASPMTAVTAAAASHTWSEPATLPISRAISPRSDWLATQPRNPVRPASLMNSPPNHHLAESAGANANGMTTVAANAAEATAACRNFLVSNRYGMKISGTSLIPAAIPTPAPFHHRLALVSGWHRSHMISAISARFTWPT